MGKIGLVLSGGVAKGAYEAGILRAMAETGVIPDVIVGISAGALNGAMAAGMVAGETFTPKNVDERLVDTWIERVSLSHFYNAFDGEDTFTDMERRSLNNLALRFGIDPLNKVYLPTKLDAQALKTLETVLRGNFISLMSHAYFRQLAHGFDFPHPVKRPCKFSAVICNLLGETSLREDDESIESGWTHYEDFHWYPAMSRMESFVQSNKVLDVVMASSSFPLVFSPMRLTPAGATKPGMFIDGGMADNAPIGKAIKMDPEVDTILIVMATTIVPPPEQEPGNIFEVFSRMSEMLAGKFIINNYHKVMKNNRRIEALASVLERDSLGDYRDCEFNETMAIAAGFGGLADFRRRRVVRLIPILPSVPLSGNLFAGFLDKQLRKDYIATGYADGMEAITKRLRAGELPPASEDAFSPLAS